MASDILGDRLVWPEFHAEASWELKERSKKSTVVRMLFQLVRMSIVTSCYGLS